MLHRVHEPEARLLIISHLGIGAGGWERPICAVARYFELGPAWNYAICENCCSCEMPGR
jgi:hypothetical protein